MAYFGNESAVPTMTSYNTPSGIVTWSSESTASSSYKGWNVFARNTTFWQSGNVASAWVAYQFPTEKRIAKYTLEAGAYPNAAPKTWTFEGSNDGLAWDVLDTQTTTQTWAVGTKRQYSINNLKSYFRYRVNVSSNMVSDAYSVCITNIEMFEMFYSNKILLSSGERTYSLSRKYTESLIPIMTSNTTPSGIASASDETATPAFRAFDGEATSTRYWAPNAKTYGWVAYDFKTPTLVGRYDLTIILSNPTFGPKSWTFEGSNDGLNWVVLDTQNNQTTWINNTPNVYDIKTPSYYQRYRLNITTNNGAVSVGVGEMRFYGIKLLALVSFHKNPDEKMFETYGMSEIADLSINIGETSEPINTSDLLGTGKTFEHTVNMSKRQINKILLGG
ncbi:discoidin domain-containing protein [Paenibacillus sp. FSL H3-0286]|uniref:discoidin domain-containing protein n=1 Tax=Paenibacillus sp. FSL H3-0286 TaxID=2921427 RepID=UPI0032477FA3